MTTAVGDVVYDVTSEADENPWSESNVAFSNNNWRIVGGELEPDTTTWANEFCYYTGTVSATTISSQIEVIGTPDYKRVGAAVLNSSGNGYVLTFYGGDTVRLRPVSAWVLGTTTTEYDLGSSHTSGYRYKIEIDTSTGTDNVVCYQESTAIITHSDASLPSSLTPAIFALKEGSTYVGVSSWGLGVGSGETIITTTVASLSHTVFNAGIPSAITTTPVGMAYSTFNTTIEIPTRTLGSVTGTVAPGEQITINCTGVGTVSSVTLGGEALTIDAQNNGNPICTIPTDINLLWGNTYSLVVTDPSGTVSADHTLSARSGWEIVNWVGPAPDTATTESFYEIAISDFGITADTGDQLQFSSATGLTVDGQWVPTVSPAASRSGTYAVYDASATARSAEATYNVLLAEEISTTVASVSYTTFPAVIENELLIVTSSIGVVYTVFNASVTAENNISTTAVSTTTTVYAAVIETFESIDTNSASMSFNTYPATIIATRPWVDISPNTTIWREL
ncbi:MAG: hypothetical protein JAY60_18535 [Candidatus Thiodiazotropha weberae]|nr:hypothetical protein [Candidatus Thiodiazotropha weberae]